MAKYYLPAAPLRDYIKTHYPYVGIRFQDIQHWDLGRFEIYNNGVVADKVFTFTLTKKKMLSIKTALERILNGQESVNYITLDEFSCALGIHPVLLAGEDWLVPEEEWPADGHEFDEGGKDGEGQDALTQNCTVKEGQLCFG